MNKEINLKAPVISKQSVEINAPVEKVWKILTGINEWENWQSQVTHAEIIGQPKEGAFFIWYAKGLTFKSQIHTCMPFQKFGWTGKTVGANAIHNWNLVDNEKNTTVFVEESLQGFIPELFKRKFQEDLNEGMQKNLEELKLVSERR